MENYEAAPLLRKLAEKETDAKKKKLLAEVAETIEHALEDAESMKNTSRDYANMTQRQRDALHEVIKTYSKEVKDVELRNRMLKDSNRILKAPPTVDMAR